MRLGRFAPRDHHPLWDRHAAELIITLAVSFCIASAEASTPEWL